MDTQKRRIVYFSDPEWEAVRKRAAEQGVSISAYLRSLGWGKAVGEPGHVVQRPAEPGVSTRFMTQAERDAVLGKVARKRRH